MSKESIKEIGSRLKMAENAEREQLMKVYAPDDRAGVQKLLEKYRKQKEKLLAEKERLAKMRQYEEKYADYAFICGIDEVGTTCGSGGCRSRDPAQRVRDPLYK